MTEQDAAKRPQRRKKDSLPPRAGVFEVLTHQGILRPAVLPLLTDYRDRWSLSEYEVILTTRQLTEAQMADALASVLRLDRVYSVRSLDFDHKSLESIAFAEARARRWLAVGPRPESGVSFEVIVADPTDYDALAELSARIPQEITLAVAERSDIVEAIDELYPLALQVPSFKRDD